MPTGTQIAIAVQHGIPKSQADTVNVDKAIQYYRWCNSEECRVERLLNHLDNQRLMVLQAEWMNCQK